jgi:hypothetical protein
MIVSWIRTIKLKELYEELVEANIISKESFNSPDELRDELFDGNDGTNDYYYFSLDSMDIFDEFTYDIAQFITKQVGGTEFVMVDCFHY